MPREVIAGSLAATAAVPTQIVMFGNDSRTVRFFPDGKKAFLLDLFTSGHTVHGPIVVKSPKLHDNNLGIHFTPLNAGENLVPWDCPQPMYSQDNLDILMADTLGAGDWDNVLLEVYYEELQGNNGNYVNYDAIKGKIKNIVSIEITDTAAAALGYQNSHNLTQITDLLKGNTNYALLGYETTGDQFAATLNGPCTGNMRICMPNNQNALWDSQNYFIRKSQRSNFPCIPVLNSADRYGTFVEFLEDVGTTSDSIFLIFGEL
jgi:hypothetical protein